MKDGIQQKTLISFIAGLEGKLLTTSARKKQFRVNVVEEDLIFTPLSSGKIRKESAHNLTKLITHFNTTKTLRPKDYHDVTFNSVYVITLLEMYLIYLSKRVS